ncbi:MAG: uL13 family ribosomal protein [Oligoflexia bacterium]|nr:uL13 family ribosomal protein [Oligoflexia bacterium]
MVKTWVKKKEDIQRDWKIVDASGKPLGRLASAVAHLLMGKNKPDYTPHVMGGDFVIVVNSNQVQLTGKNGYKKSIISTLLLWVLLKKSGLKICLPMS